jgi:hypothetical protein
MDNLSTIVEKILSTTSIIKIFNSLYKRPIFFDQILTSCNDYEKLINVKVNSDLCKDKKEMVRYLQECQNYNRDTSKNFTLILYNSKTNEVVDGFSFLKINKKGQLEVTILCGSGKFLMILIFIIAIELGKEVVLLPTKNAVGFYTSLGFVEQKNNLYYILPRKIYQIYQNYLQSLKEGKNIDIIIDQVLELSWGDLDYN